MNIANALGHYMKRGDFNIFDIDYESNKNSHEELRG